MSESTKVLFPRFQAEATWQVDERLPDVIESAQWRGWLPGTAVEKILDPEAIAEEIKERDITGRWWGAKHWASAKITETVELTVPRTRHQRIWGQPALTSPFSTKVIKHEYSWDEQALRARKREVVLRDVSEPGSPKEVAAMLVGEKRDIWTSGGFDFESQKLVLADADGNWLEPNYGGTDRMRDFYLGAMLVCAHAGASTEELRQQLSGSQAGATA